MEDLEKLLKSGFHGRIEALLSTQDKGKRDYIDRIAIDDDVSRAVEPIPAGTVFWGYEFSDMADKGFNPISVVIPVGNLGEAFHAFQEVMKQFHGLYTKTYKLLTDKFKPDERRAELRTNEYGRLGLGESGDKVTYYLHHTTPRSSEHETPPGGWISYIAGKESYGVWEKEFGKNVGPYSGLIKMHEPTFLELALVPVFAQIGLKTRERAHRLYIESLKRPIRDKEEKGKVKGNGKGVPISKAIPFTVGDAQYSREIEPFFIDYSDMETVSAGQRFSVGRVAGQCYDRLKTNLMRTFVVPRISEEGRSTFDAFYSAEGRTPRPLVNRLFLHGPPGCGKTSLVKMVAYELGKPYLEVSAEIRGGIVSHSSRAVHQIYKIARESPTGAVIVWNDFDTIVPKREGRNNAANHTQEDLAVLQVIFNETDGQRGEDDRIITCMVSNLDESAIDEALKSRLGWHQYKVDEPDRKSLAQIIHLMAGGELNEQESLTLASEMPNPIPRDAEGIIATATAWARGSGDYKGITLEQCLEVLALSADESIDTSREGFAFASMGIKEGRRGRDREFG